MEEVEQTIFRILQATYLRLLCGSSAAMTDKEQATTLLPHAEALRHDLAQIMVAVSRGQDEAVQAMRFELHRAEGIDHEMVDQALAFARGQREKEGAK